jgi:hypothetical protein
MKIDRVTISGADDTVNVSELLRLQRKYPFVEWGVLVSKKRMGQKRYPTEQWIKSLPYELRLSMHFCGEIGRQFVNKPTPELLFSPNGDHWERTQLNFSFKEDTDYTDNLFSIALAAAATPNKSIVLAYNKSSKKNLDSFIKSFPSLPENVHFLYDSSGGRGTEIKSFSKPLINYTGYAGGLNPENVFTICETLTNMEWEDNVWIDMESGVRTNDVFDLSKAESVLKTCSTFINPYSTKH